MKNRGFTTIASLATVVAIVAASVLGYEYMSTQMEAQRNVFEAYLNQVERALSNQEDRLNENLLQSASFGAFRPSNYVGKLLTRLDEGGSETTFKTSPGTAADGSTLTTAKVGDFIVFTINPGAANEEKVSVSAVSVSGTTATWTIINRGLSFTENAAVTANKTQHAIGETVIISNDDHYLSQQYVDVDTTGQTIAGQKTFTLGALFSVAASSTDECDSSTEYCTKNYIDNSSNQGAATSTETNGGIAELATALEAASSTDFGTSRPLVLQAKNATDTPLSGCASGYESTAGAGCGIIARLTGKISQTFLDLTESFDFTGTLKDDGVEGGLVPVGSIQAYASSTPPTGWLTADGSAVSRTTYAQLFYVIGTVYGVGDGSTTFNLPNLSGRNIIMASSTANMAQSGGESNHTMTTAELVQHTHTIQAYTGGGGTPGVNSGGGVAGNTGTTDNGPGTAKPFNVLDPYLTAWYIIKY